MPATADTHAHTWRPGARGLSMAAAVLIAAALLYYSLRGIDWLEVAHIVRGAAPLPLLAGAALGTVSLFLRAWRWRILLNAEGTVDVPTAFWATAAGYFGNNFLPARAGELVRTYMIASRSTLSNTYVLATALSERIADAVALVVISAGALLLLPAQPGWLSGAARPFAVLGLLGAIAIAVLPLLEGLVRAAIARAPLPGPVRLRLTGVLEQAFRGMRSFHDGRRLGGFLVLTVILWSVDALGAIVVARALGLDLPVAAAFLLIAGLGVGSALPSTPGYVGIYQFVAVTVLTPFGFSRTAAIAYILVAQAASYVVNALLGSLAIWRYRGLAGDRRSR